MNEKTAGQVYKKNIGGVVAIATQRGNRGSGIIVGDNEVVTNCHIVDDGSPVMVLQPPDSESSSPKQFPAQIIVASAHDMCLLKADGLSASAVQIGTSKPLDIGSPVYAIGHPGGVFGTLSSGIVSQLHPDSIQTTAAMSGGSSGGGLFDHEGRLVGITTGSLGTGESLHKALRVELVEDLRQRTSVEAPLHNELAAALDNPSPAKFRELADRIVFECFSDMQEAAESFGRMGCVEGEEFAAAKVKNIRTLAERAPAKQRDPIMAEAIRILATMGKLDEALKYAEEIRDERSKIMAYAHIARGMSHKNIAEARKFHSERIPSDDALDGNDLFLLNEIAHTRAAMEDSEQALRITERMRSHPGFGHPSFPFPLFVETLARIAEELWRQKIYIGAQAIFSFAGDSTYRGKHHSSFQKLFALALVAYYAANCGARADAIKALEAIKRIEEEHRDGDGHYGERIQRMAIIAETMAWLGNLENAIQGIRRIPVLGGEVAEALVCAAVMMDPKTQAEFVARQQRQ